MRPLNMMMAGGGGGGDVGGTKSGRRGIEACKEKLKEGLRASDLRNVVAAAAAVVVAAPSHWRRTANQTMRETGLFLPGRGGGLIWLLMTLFVVVVVLVDMVVFDCCST